MVRQQRAVVVVETKCCVIVEQKTSGKIFSSMKVQEELLYSTVTDSWATILMTFVLE